MSDCLKTSGSAPACSRRFQFSLRTLLIVSVLFAIFFAGIFNNHNFVRYLALMAFETVSFYIFLVWAIYGRGHLRTFGIGATISYLFPWVITLFFWFCIVFSAVNSNNPFAANLFGTYTYVDRIDYFWPSLAALMLILDAILAGGSMVLARWLIDRSRRQAEKKEFESSSTNQEVCSTKLSPMDLSV
jgi:hypothetical protein